MRNLVRPTAVIVAYFATIAMNTLANVLPLAGRNTGDISARFPIPFTPAGWVFSIWGLIYLALAVYAIYQALPSKRDDRLLDIVGWLFVVSCAFNIAWLVAWHNLEIGLTLPLMLGLFASLLAIYGVTRRRADTAPVTAGTAEAPLSGTATRGFRWAVRTPFSLYLGWITVATVANVAIFLYDLGWQPGRDAAVAWSFALVAIAACIGLWVVYRNRDAVYAAVLVWAFTGIAVKEWDATLLSTGAVVAAGILALIVLRTLIARYTRSNSRSDSVLGADS